MANIEFQNDQIQIIGQVSFVNAESVYQKGYTRLKQQQNWPVYVDLSQLEQGNTLVLAIFVQWLRHCPDHQSLKFTSVSDKMLGIIRASNLQHLILE